ncbi:PGF-pre-PGF domain-containing protein [Methanosarcina sp. DH2]|uniref:PKD domain-containing protein n=1 Tax=Methanosarcina sp. DH2 TaxID=2605639 RepID=UPI001E2BCFF6|nr:PGF-pre-PGF domain-containing protein [Methanosarcina sp. DH2]MCC4769884.1 PGF-pre-PGF domain-containing protein [Methanosarcina sp. DH2]
MEIRNKSITLPGIFLILVLISGIGAAAEITVEPGNSIQDAVNNASSGDTIIIKPGTYTENVKIYTDSLAIRSASGNPDDTMIKAKNTTDNAILVKAANVKISGVKAAAATGSSASGICLSGCNNCIVENNKLTSEGQGIYLVSSTGCTVSGNTVINCGYFGIVLGSSKSNTITGNTVTNSARGIYIGNSDDNTVSGNTVTLNSVLGYYSCSLCDRNRIYNNYFNNTEISVKSGSGNSYNTTKTPGTNIIGGSYIGGNYWGKPDGTGFSDTAVDKDGDGISDSAYSLPGSSYLDYLPLVYPSNSPEPVLPVADFSSDVTSGNAPLTVTFKDRSTGDPTEWDWDFGDGNVSTEQSPVHTYTSAGTYTVKLTVSNADGAASKDGKITVFQKPEPIIEPVIPVADFSSNVTSGNAPLDVSFADKSTGAPTSWNWNFGDGTNSEVQNPVHTYPSAGDYTVNLTVSNANGTASKTGAINVLQNPEPYPDPALPAADFGTNATQGPAPLVIQFTDLSQNAVSWSWDFDNNGQPDSTVQSPVYVYTSTGTYTANMTARNANGTASKTLEIKVLEAEKDTGLPVADFNANVTSGYAPLSVLFTDNSQNATEIGWDFDNDRVTDVSSSTVVYVYTFPGTYTVNLLATNANGTAIKTLEIKVLEESSSGGSSHKSSGGSSSGGGGGGGSPEPARNVETKELSQVFITNGKAVKFDFTKNATCVVYIGFDAIKNVGKTTTIVEQLKNKSALVSELPSGEVYKSFNVWVGNSGYATSKNIENPVICFKVEKAWLQDQKIDKSSITLNRYSNKTWEQLPVSLSGEDDKFLYFETEVKGFSSFAITGKAKNISGEGVTDSEPEQEIRSIEREDTKNIKSKVEQNSEQGEDTTVPGFELIYRMVCLSVIFLYKRK